MAGKDDEPTPPGWSRQHDDPGTLRWWDGEDWTADTMPAPPAGSRAPAPPAGRAGSTPEPQRRRAPQGRPQPARATQRSGQRSGQRSAARAPQQGAAARPAQRPAQRPPQRMAPRGASRPGARAPGRTVQSERVVRRRSKGPGPGVRVALRALIIAAAVGVLYLGYVQIRDAEAPDARTLSEAPADAPDEQLRPVADAVLDLGDLPAGWSAQTHDPASDDICEGRTPRSVIVPDDVASAAFTQGALGPYLTTTIARFSDRDAAVAFMDLTQRVVETCREYQVGDAAVRLGPLEYPRFGEDTFVAAASGESGVGAITGRLVYVRVDRLVASVETLALGDGTVSDQLVEHLANLLAKRLRSL